MKSVVAGVVIVLFLVAGCSKTNTTSNSSRDAFVGSYLMHDTIALQTGATVNDTTVTVSSYTMTVLAVSGTTDKIALNNINNRPYWDTAIVNGNVASFTNSSPSAANATLNGTRITLKGGYIYSNIFNPVVYGIGVGIKQ